MAGAALKTQVLVDLESRARIAVLHETVEELVRGFLGREVPGSVVSTLRKGIIENQYLASVSVSYLLGDGKKVGGAQIEIDWEKHEANLVKDGQRMGVARDKSVVEQISQLFPIFFDHMERMSAAYGVEKREVHYFFRPEIWKDNEKLKKVHAELGLQSCDAFEWSDKGELDSDGTDFLEMTGSSGILSEVTVTIQTLKKPKK